MSDSASLRTSATIPTHKPEAEQPEIRVDVLIVGAGPAGASLASFLGFHGVEGLVISRDSTTSLQPRAHITNGAAFECLRDIGLEDAWRDVAVDNSHYGTYRFAQSLKGKDYVRLPSFGKSPSRLGDYQEATPCPHADVSQNVAEPILLKYATQHGFQSRFNCKFLEYTEDCNSGMITSTIEDQVTMQKLRVVSKYLCGADGTNSYVARQAGLPYHMVSGGGIALNVWYEADLSGVYRLNPGLLHCVLTQDIDSPPWCLVGVNRVVRPWTEFIMGMQAAPGVTSNDVTEEEVVAHLRRLIRDDDIKIKVKGIYKWKINEAYAETLSKGNVFCLGDAIHKHPPGNGLGSNTCIQDAYNLAWKLAYVLKGKAGPSLLDSYNLERQPVGKRVVKIANDAHRRHYALHNALGVYLPTVEQRMKFLQVLQEDSLRGRQQRAILKAAYEDVQDETHGLGAEMNQKYLSNVIYVDDETEPGPTWEEGSRGVRYHTISTYPGSRLPHAWLGTDRVGEKVSTHDIAGHGEFALLTGIGGKVWYEAAEKVRSTLGIRINVYGIGVGLEYSDMFYTWEERRGVEENGAVLIRPDRTVAWRSRDLRHAGRLLTVVQKILGL